MRCFAIKKSAAVDRADISVFRHFIRRHHPISTQGVHNAPHKKTCIPNLHDGIDFGGRAAGRMGGRRR